MRITRAGYPRSRSTTVLQFALHAACNIMLVTLGVLGAYHGGGA
jgi:hypothetical protein